MALTTLIGPFSQLVSLAGLARKGALKNAGLEIIPQAGLLVSEGHIVETGMFEDLWRRNKGSEIAEISGDHVLLPGFIDAHTHLIFAGSRGS